MKKGDKVTVRDSSYSRSIIDEKLVHETGILYNKQYTIIEIDCKFPVLDSMQLRYESMDRFNNTVIQAVDSGKVVFIEERFLKLVLPTHKVMVDIRQDGDWMYGEIVEISNELYRQIKK